MEQYKKVHTLSNDTIDEIKHTQKDLIMNRINQRQNNSKPFFFIPHKNIMVYSFSLIIIIAITVVFSGINKEQHTVEEVYTTLSEYRERLEQVEIDVVIPSNHVVSSPKTRYMRLSSKTIVHSRESLEEIYLNQTIEIEPKKYVESFQEATSFIDEVLLILENNEAVVINEYFNINTGFYGYDAMKISYMDDDSIIIKAKHNEIETDFITCKISLIEDHIELYVLQTNVPVFNWEAEDAFVSFQYFELVENEYVFTVQSMETDYIYSHYNFNTLISSQVLKVTGSVDGTIEDQEGLIVSLYSALDNQNTYLEIVNGEVTAELYSIMNDKGSVFDYIDTDTSDNKIMLSWNMMLAEGWDVVLVESPYGTNNFVEGFYDRGDYIYTTGDIRLYKTNTHVGVYLQRIIIEDELTDEMLHLGNTNLTWTKTEITKESLDNLRIKDIAFFIQEIPQEDFNFFEDDLTDELFNYLNEDLKE